MQQTKLRTKRTTTSEHRLATAPRKRKDTKFRQKTSQKNVASFRPVRLHTLKLKPFYRAERFFINSFPDDYGENLFLSSRCIIQCIEDIYPVIKEDISVFVNQIQITEETSPIAILCDMLDKYGLVEKNEFDIMKMNGRYYLVINDLYDIEEKGYSIPAQPFFVHRKQYPYLYQAFLTMCALLWRKANFWDDEFHERSVQFIEDSIEDLDSEDIKWHEQCLKDYFFGLKALQSARKAEKPLTDKMIHKIEIPKFKAWFEMGRKLSEYKDCLGEFINLNFADTECGYPATAMETTSFMWTWDDSNPIFDEVDACFQNNTMEFGFVNFSQANYLNKDNLKPSTKSDFPYLWIEFLNEGNELIKKFLDHGELDKM